MGFDEANSIVKSSKKAYVEHCEASECEIKVTMRLERPSQDPVKPHVISVVPMEHHLVFRYGGLTFRAPRADGAMFLDAVSSLFGMLLDKVKEADLGDKRDDEFERWHSGALDQWDYYFGGGDPYAEATFQVVRHGEVQVEVARMPLEDMEGVFVHHVGAMRFLSCY